MLTNFGAIAARDLGCDQHPMGDGRGGRCGLGMNCTVDGRSVGHVSGSGPIKREGPHVRF